MWEFQHMNMEKLPKHLQRDLRRLIRYVYRAHRETPPPGTTISIGYTDSRPECSWANIIELHPDWTLVSAYLAQSLRCRTERLGIKRSSRSTTPFHRSRTACTYRLRAATMYSSFPCLRLEPRRAKVAITGYCGSHLF